MIGLHRPRFDHDEFAGLSLEQAKSAYNKMLSAVVEKLQESQVSETIIERMMATPSSSIYYLSKEELELIGFRSPFLEELLTAKCKQFIPDLQRYQSLVEEEKAAGRRYDDMCTNSGAEPECVNLLMQRYTLMQEKWSATPKQFNTCIGTEAFKLSAKAQGISD